MRSMPEETEIETYLLGTCLYRPEIMALTAEQCDEAYFRAAGHAAIWQKMLDLYNKGLEVTPAALMGLFKEDTIKEYVSALADFAMPISLEGCEKNYIKRLRDAYRKRMLITEVDYYLGELEDPSSDVQEISEKIEAIMFRLAEGKTIKGPTLDGWQRALKQIEAAKTRGGVVGLSTGFSRLDEIIGGMADTNMIVLAGRPGMGKTSLAVSIAEAAANSDHNVMFSSLEMSADQICLKRQSMLSGIDSNRMYRGEISDDEMRQLVSLQDNRRFFIDDTAAVTPETLLSRARRLKRQHGLGLIVTDYMQLMKASGVSDRDSQVARVTAISNAMKQIAKEVGVPVLVLSQLSRAVEQREDKRPVLSDLRESGAIEQDADVVMFVYRDEYYLEREVPKQFEKESEEKFAERSIRYRERLEAARGKADVIVAKNRHGGIGTATLGFECSTTAFKEL